MSKPLFRMSAAGYCPKRLSARLLGTAASSPPPWLSSSAEEGNWHEARIKQELRDLGCVVDNEQLEVKLEFPEFLMVGHIDGTIQLSKAVLSSSSPFELVFWNTRPKDLDLSQVHLLEVKSFSFLEYQRWTNGEFANFPHYAAQSVCYERALSKGIMVYAVKDRSNGARRLYVIKGEQSSMPAIVDKLQEVVYFTSKGQLAPAEYDIDSIECRRCEFRIQLCAPIKAQVDDAVIEQAAANYIEGRAMEKEGKALADEAKDLLVKFANDKGYNRWDVGGYTVSYSHYPRETISIKRLGELMPREQFEEAISVSNIDRVRVINNTKES